jgi:deoxyadenosine/deoxycytidine kinase
MFDEKLRISAIEGNSYSGKTTLLRELKQNYPIEVVRESMKYVEPAHKFPPFPPQSIEDAKRAVQVFVELEKVRLDHVMELTIKTGKPVIMDRSPFSAIVFEYALKEKHPERLNVYGYSIELFQEQIKQGNLSIPSVVVYLEPAKQNIFLERVKARGRVRVDFLNNPETVKVMQGWYRDVLNRYYSTNSALILKSQQGDTEVMASLVSEFLHKANYANNSDLILSDLRKYD